MVDEFSLNENIVGGCFWHLFPLGVDNRSLDHRTGGVAREILRRLFTFYDPRFAECGTLRAHLFSQQLRHGASQQVSVAFKNDKGRIKEFETMIQAAGFQKRLQQAHDNPKRASSKKLMKEISPLIQIVGRKLPWTPMERRQAVAQIYGLAYMMGLPTWWVTFNPGMMDNPLVVRMLQRKRGEAVHAATTDWGVHGRLPNTQERALLIARNPFESARGHDHVRELVWKSLMGLSDASEHKVYTRGEGARSPTVTVRHPTRSGPGQSRAPLTPCTVPGVRGKLGGGIFGHTTAGYMVAECTQRGDLHDHALLYGLPNPRMVSEWCHMPETEAAVTELIDECTSSRLPEEHRSRDGDEWRKLSRLGRREPPETRARKRNFIDFWEDIMP